MIDAHARGQAAHPVDTGPDERDHKQSYESAHPAMLPSHAETSVAACRSTMSAVRALGVTSRAERSTRNSWGDSLYADDPYVRRTRICWLSASEMGPSRTTGRDRTPARAGITTTEVTPYSRQVRRSLASSSRPSAGAGSAP